MKEALPKRRAAKALIALALVVSLAALLSGCWPFNEKPVALITAGPLTTGKAPLTVNFSGLLSSDSDGTIRSYEWHFGDGGTAATDSVPHTYTAQGTYIALLKVTDDDGETGTAQVTINVLAPDPGTGGGDSPTASFTATPVSGAAPLVVTFNASASVYTGHAITAYFWDFGDGGSGTGVTTAHTYSPASTSTYTAILRIIASDNKEATASKPITVTVVGPTPPTNAPTASFTVSHNSIVAPLLETFDPAASGAATGRTIVNYIWTFGDGTAPVSTGTDAPQTHRYVTSQPSQLFTVTLTVIDDHGANNTASRTVTVQNYTPVAGFEIYDTRGGPALPGGGTWKHQDVTFNNVLQTSSHTVWFQSKQPDSWVNTTPLAGTEPTPRTATPGTYTANNLSYDREGQGWTAGNPSGFPSVAWGIQSMRWNFGDGNLVDVNVVSGTMFNPLSHSYTFVTGYNQWTVTITVTDYLGQQATFSRKLVINGL